MTERDLSAILADAVRSLEPVPAAVSKFPEKSILQPENRILHTYEKTDVDSCIQELSVAIGYMENGKNGEYRERRKSAWEPVARLFPYLERAADPRLFDYLNPDMPIGDMPPKRWAQFIADARAFVLSGWYDRARALGWSINDLFGADDVKPYARIDQAGLVLLLNGDRVIAIGPDAAAIETANGLRLTYRRRFKRGLA